MEIQNIPDIDLAELTYHLNICSPIELGNFLGEVDRFLKKWGEVRSMIKEEAVKRYNDQSQKEFGNYQVIVQNQKSFDKKKFEASATDEEKSIQEKMADAEYQWSKITKKYEMLNQIAFLKKSTN